MARVKIESIEYHPLRKEFEATVVERDDAGKEVTKITATSQSLLRLCDIIQPAQPDNM